MSKKLIYVILFVLVLGLTTTSAGQDIAEGLVAYWPLDDGGGATASDASGNEYDGTLNGGPVWGVGMFGGALDFDGADDYVDCGNPGILNFGTGDFTISAWIKMPAASETNTIFANGGDDGGGVRYTLSMGESNDNGITMLTDDNSDKIRAEGATLVTDDLWHHVVGMREGTTLRTSVDGVYEDGINDLPSAGYDLSGTSQKNVLIGAIWSEGDNVIKKHFSGLIDDVAIWNRALTVDEIGYLWNDGIGNSINVSPPGQASDPFPADEQTDVLRDVVLSWAPGDFADKHDVYLGTNFDDVNDATATVDPSGVYMNRQDTNIYPFGGTIRLDFGQTYYWRIDQVSAPPDNTIYKGNVWQFTVEPLAYQIPGENISTSASSGEPDKGPENTINGSGLDESGLLHGNISVDTMWLSSPIGDQPTWIEYEFDKVYKLHEMWVWNSNDSLEQVVGFGFKDVTIEYSVNGFDYTTLETVHEFARAPGSAGYAHNTTVDFSGTAVKYIRLTANSNWGEIFNQFGLSEVRFFHIPVHAGEPGPDSGAVDIALDVTLNWRAGREAAEYNLYFSDDEQAVIDGTAPVTTLSQPIYGPMSLDLGKTYYWRVDEVNNANPDSVWAGDIWSFTTMDFLVVDDMESYNGINEGESGSNRIYLAWVDGYDNPAINGSTVGHLDPPFVEQTIVHSGNQSMPFAYDNGVGKSEATLALTSNRDWTVNGVNILTIWFRGEAANAAQTMYVVLNGNSGVDNPNPNAAQVEDWTEWRIDLQEFAINLTNVDTVTLGLGNRTNPVAGGSGMMYFDDIRLYAQ